MINQNIISKLQATIRAGKKVTFLCGAGISAESGIPTFRGKEGYWVAGSVHYQPSEIGTYRMFCTNEKEVWKWFLFRKTVCRKAVPNPGHLALKQIEDLMGDQFAIISQNVDSLHKRAGNSEERTYLIHGDLDYVRCASECTHELYPFPDGIGDKTRESDVTEVEWALLKCPKCGDSTRPHVLWFDEYYNEQYYRIESALKVAQQTGVLFIVGTSGATTGPRLVVNAVMKNDGIVVDVNVGDNYFANMANDQIAYSIQGKSGTVLPLIETEIRNIVLS